MTLGRPVQGILTRAAGVIQETQTSEDLSVKQNNVLGLRTTASFPKSPVGGPIFDSTGHLVGVMGDLHMLQGAKFTGGGEAVAVNLFVEMVTQWGRNNLEAPQGWMGVEVMSVTPALARSLKLGRSRGALVQFVLSGSPASAAGIHGGTNVATVKGRLQVVGGDVIVSINGAPVRTYDDLFKAAQGSKPGTILAVGVMRGRVPLTLKVKVGTNPLRT